MYLVNVNKKKLVPWNFSRSWQLFASKLTIFEVTNFAPALSEVIHMFSLVFINNYAIFKVVRI